MRLSTIRLVCLSVALVGAGAADPQTPPVQPASVPGQPSIAETRQNTLITLQDAQERAKKYGLQIQSANIAAALAKEDRVQARAGSLPTVTAFNQFIYTEGNGTPSGVFVANDGVHVYNEQAQVHEELLAFVRRGEIRYASASFAVAQARIAVAARGLSLTVVQNYYAIAAALQKTGTARISLNEAQRFADITQQQEQGGEVAHSDVIKARIQVQQRQRDLQDADLAVQKAKFALAVLIFPTLRDDFDVQDDLSTLLPLPAQEEITRQATATSPDLQVAQATLRQNKLGVSTARYAYLPSLGLDVFYGINANQFAATTTHPTQATGRSTLPNYLVDSRQNLGYSAQATLNIPVWNWGATHSKVKQASLRERQSELDLTLAQRNLQSQVAAAYREAQTAFAQVESLRSSNDLSAESLRLTLLRYQAGEATVLEVTDAQSTANLARNAYVDGLLRYRLAIGTVQNLTGATQP